MSLATLSKKHKAKKGLSSGKENFSLKGTSRANSYIGVSRLNSSLKTIYKGTEPVGYGGNCGTFVNTTISNNKTSNLANPTSTLTTSGYLSKKITSLNNCETGEERNIIKNWVKSFNAEEHSQSEYIKNKKISASHCVTLVEDAGIDNCCKTSYVGTRKINRSNYNKNINTGAISAHEYIETTLSRKYCLPTPECKKSFPIKLNNGNCARHFSRPEEAIEAGLLPKNWMNCTSKEFINNPYI